MTIKAARVAIIGACAGVITGVICENAGIVGAEYWACVVAVSGIIGMVL